MDMKQSASAFLRASFIPDLLTGLPARRIQKCAAQHPASPKQQQHIKSLKKKHGVNDVF
jgi:hypothetical protein